MPLHFSGTLPSSPWHGYQEQPCQSHYGSENWNSEEEEDTASAFGSDADTCDINPNVQDKVRQVRFWPGFSFIFSLYMIIIANCESIRTLLNLVQQDHSKLLCMH